MMLGKQLLDTKIEIQAWDRGHSAGKEEVNMIEKSLKHDFKEVYEYIEHLESLVAQLKQGV